MSAGNCDGCGQWRKDVKSIGRDSNGDPDAPDFCFFCRKRLEERRPPLRRDEAPSDEDIRARQDAWEGSYR